MIRIAVVSMLVRDALPEEVCFTVRAEPWESAVADESSNGAAGSSSGAAADPMLVFSVYRDEFTQEGPSGPIEAKRILLVRAMPNQRTRVTFELEPSVMEQLGFCQPPPLLLEHRRSSPAAASEQASASGHTPAVAIV